MVIYLDLLLIENFFLNFILLWITGKLLGKKETGVRLLLASLAGALGTVLPMLMLMQNKIPAFLNANVFFALFRFALALFLLRLAFPLTSLRQWVTGMLLLYGFSFLLKGMLEWGERWAEQVLQVKAHSSFFWGMLLFGFLFFARFYAVLKERFFQKQYSVPVLLQVGKRQASGRGLLDSGNGLTEPITQKPVVVVERQLLKQNEIDHPAEGCFAIPYHAVGTDHGILKGFVADELHILEDDGERVLEKVMIGIYEGRLSMRGEYQILLNPKL